MVTHGIKTPDFWWKGIHREDKKAYVAWLFPNSQRATASKIDNFLISIADLASRLDFMPDLGSVRSLENAGVSPLQSWEVEKSSGPGGSAISCEGLSTSPG